jgi:hypothetical protein
VPFILQTKHAPGWPGDESSVFRRFPSALSCQVRPPDAPHGFPCPLFRLPHLRLQRKHQSRPRLSNSLRRPPLRANLRNCRSESPAELQDLPLLPSSGLPCGLPSTCACDLSSARSVRLNQPPPGLRCPGVPGDISVQRLAAALRWNPRRSAHPSCCRSGLRLPGCYESGPLRRRSCRRRTPPESRTSHRLSVRG